MPGKLEKVSGTFIHEVKADLRVVASVFAGDPQAFDALQGLPTEPGGSISSHLLFKAKTLTDQLDENSLGARMIRSVYFKGGVNASILLSAIFMGVQTHSLRHDDDPDRSILWTLTENVFTFIFAAEMALKVYVIRRPYFMGFWNLMDFGIAWVSILDTWVLRWLPSDGDQGINFQLFKIFRLLRLSRMLRFFNAVSELRMVVEGLAASMRALFWVTMLLFIVIYAFSIFCVEIVGHNTTRYPGYNETVTTANAFNNFEYFGSLERAFISLMSLTFMAEWTAIRAIWELQWPVIFVFLALIFITSFGIVNVIIGVIVEKITESMQEHKSEQARVHKVLVMRGLEAVADTLYKEIQEISREQMVDIAAEHDMTEVFANVEFPPGFTFDDLFTMLNIDGVGDLRKEEFLTGMRRLLFSNPTQKVCISHLSLGQVKELLQRFWASHDETVNELKQEIHELKDRVQEVLETIAKHGAAPGPATPETPRRRSSPRRKTGFVRGPSLLTQSALEPPGGAKCRRWEGRSSVREARRSMSLAGRLLSTPVSSENLTVPDPSANAASTSQAESNPPCALPEDASNSRIHPDEADAVSTVGMLSDHTGVSVAPRAELVGTQATVAPSVSADSQTAVKERSLRIAPERIAVTSFDESDLHLRPWRNGAIYVQL